MCGPGGGSPSCPIPSPHERPGRGGARRTVARRSPSAPVLIGRVGTASAPRFTDVLQRSDRPHAQTAYQRSEQLLHTPTYSRTRMDVLRTRATRGSLATSAYRTRGPLDGHLAPPSSAVGAVCAQAGPVTHGRGDASALLGQPHAHADAKSRLGFRPRHRWPRTEVGVAGGSEVAAPIITTRLKILPPCDDLRDRHRWIELDEIYRFMQ